MTQTEIKNLIELYTKKLLQLKRSNSIPSIKLPKLFQNNSYHNFIKRKLEKLNSLNSRNKYNTGEKRIKEDLSTLFKINKVDEFLNKRISKAKNTKKFFTNQNNRNSSSFNSINSVFYNSNNYNVKTLLSNNRNNSNITFNKIKMIKNNEDENDNDKQNYEPFIFKKKYYINKNNYNKDIYNLIHTDNFNFFLPKIYSTPKNDTCINALNFDEHEKNKN